MEEQATHTKETPQWLKHLQENSWEAEILISGGAIFSLFQLADGLIGALDYIKEAMPFAGLNFGFVLIMTAVRGVTICFVIHLILRGLWIALVCLNSVYPDGINFNKIKLTGRYLEQAKKADLQKQILRLDNLSALIFFASFLFIVIIIGIIIVYGVTMYPMNLLVKSDVWLDRVFLIFTSLGFIYLLDFILSGPLRKSKVIGQMYFPVFAFFNTFSLGYFYRPLLQVISTNINRWKAGAFLVGLFVAAGLLAFVSLQRSFRQANILDRRAYAASDNIIFTGDDFYLDHIPNGTKVRRAAIQSDFVKDDYVRLFVPYFGQYDEFIASENKNTLSEVVAVSINESLVEKIEWFEYRRFESNQRGIIAYLPIMLLAKGKNQLSIRIAGVTYPNNRDTLVIPFWKE
ncbi:hypothetical protein BH10BAC4_BH10BAC4_25600 [soil metagenome]